MRATVFFFLLVGFVYACSDITARCDPTSDLSSTDQKTRDKAAALLRRTYTPTPRSRYDTLLAQIKPGLSREQLLALLTAYHAKFEHMVAIGTENDYFRLDDTWLLHVWIRMGVQGISGADLVKETERFWVPAPHSFTGIWIEYYANGQKSLESTQEGTDLLKQIFYYDNGRPWCIWTDSGLTYYYRDGRVQPTNHVTETPVDGKG